MIEPEPPGVENGVPIRIDALRKQTDDQLEVAILRSSHSVGGSDILAERARREAAKQTGHVVELTVIITIATIINVAIFLWEFVHPISGR